MSDKTVTANKDTYQTDVKTLVDKESDNLHNILDPKDVSAFKALTSELRDTWNKKQIYRTETEMRFSVLNDLKYPNKAAKYWQCVREQSVYLEQLMQLSFEYRRNEAKIKQFEKKLSEETDEYKKEIYEIQLDERNWTKANMQLTAKDRMREIKLWSKIKQENDDGSFDSNNVDQHQLETYHKVMQNRAETLNQHSNPPEMFNILGQLKTIERVKKEKGQLESQKREAISSESKPGEESK
tara:strand:+ start:1478 stop:2197 length:720 start_codon:yes stop_codon:yes gene_type:complete